MFNGVVREVPNQMNLNYFFDNVNPNHRAKVFAFKVPHFGEIWWCYPKGEATECTHAIIYNVRENSWYDTELPASGRASGGYNNGFAAPLLTDCIPTTSGTGSLGMTLSGTSGNGSLATTGTASLGGTPSFVLSGTASNTVGRYTLLTGAAVTGTASATTSGAARLQSAEC
jgi:hypothetical protein